MFSLGGNCLLSLGGTGCSVLMLELCIYEFSLEKKKYVCIYIYGLLETHF